MFWTIEYRADIPDYQRSLFVLVLQVSVSRKYADRVSRLNAPVFTDDSQPYHTLKFFAVKGDKLMGLVE
jgi:hypothetical protein